ncbi:hypothetical protein SDC9_134398 [bioreactor metagenome]|uniref:HD/PDEase domain-containing protein n=1 Tax=bioreactor metagenome TaxID=1076179 RepID=A0A645DFE6_9ZZZZ
MSKEILTALLESDIWQEHQPMMADFRQGVYHGLLQNAVRQLKREALYDSPIHGEDHIERTMLMAALLAWRETVSQENTQLLLLAASYHDVGRVDDSYDTEHGPRAITKLGELAGLGGQELLLLQCAVAAHSRPDSMMEATLTGIAPKDMSRALALSRLLKDADGLDRVRIRDLNPNFLRHRSARALSGFSEYVFELYFQRKAAPAAYWCPKRQRIIMGEKGEI